MIVRLIETRDRVVVGAGPAERVVVGAGPAERVVVGAGPAGLAAALTLARAGERVCVLERRPQVGWRFAHDFQGLENWSGGDVLARLAALGVMPDFAHRPFHEVTFYDGRLRPAVLRSREPLFYLVRRGPDDGSLDRALLRQAEEAGVVVRFGQRAEHAEPGWIIATGPPLTDCTAQGYVFPTALEDQARAIISREVTPFGYAYLLVWDGWATLAACLLDPKAGAHGARERAAAAFQRVISGLDLSGARPFLGRGCLLRRLCPTDEAGRLYAGEAAGLQDPVWGFGLRYALESGALAARCLLEGLDYGEEVRGLFAAPRRTGFFNRLVFRSATGAAVERMLFWVGARGDARRRLARFCASGRAKSLLGRAVEVEAGRRPLYRNQACHDPLCRCVGCRCAAKTGGDGPISGCCSA
ncbi:MAG: hypothetical protein Kow00122_08010 [Thermoleophilia bacterium]